MGKRNACTFCHTPLTAENRGPLYGVACRACEEQHYAEGTRHMAEVSRHLARAKLRVPKWGRAKRRPTRTLNATVPGNAVDTEGEAE